MTDRLGDILRDHITMIQRQLNLIEQGVAIEDDDPERASRQIALIQDLEAVHANLDSHIVLMSRK